MNGEFTDRAAVAALTETIIFEEDVPLVVELRDGGPGVMVRR